MRAGLEELKSCMERVTDDACVAQYCISATLPTFEATLDMLQLAKARVRVPVNGFKIGVPVFNRETMLIMKGYLALNFSHCTIEATLDRWLLERGIVNLPFSR